MNIFAPSFEFFRLQILIRLCLFSVQYERYSEEFIYMRLNNRDIVTREKFRFCADNSSGRNAATRKENNDLCYTIIITIFQEVFPWIKRK